MRKASVGDIKEPQPGDTIALFSGSYDPAHLDYARAMDILVKRPGISAIWVCPLHPRIPESDAEKRVRDMATIFCADRAGAGNPCPTCCTVALDKKMASEAWLLEWARTSYPFLRFVLATMNPNPDCDQPIIIKFAMQDPSTRPGTSVLFVNQFFPVGHGMKDRIRSGSDESRNFTPGVWSYIQENKMYRS